MRSVVKRGLLTLAACLSLGSAAAAQGREIHGRVLAGGRSAGMVQGIIVTLSSDAGEIMQQTTTEGSGSFMFTGLRQQVYYVSARAPGYLEASQRADLFLIQRLTVMLTLTPDPRWNPPEAQPASGVVDTVELNLPEAAQKALKAGRDLLFKKKDSRGSLPHLKKLTELAPQYAMGFTLLGLAQMDLRQMPEASASFEKAIRLDEKIAAAHLSLGVCLNEQGEFAAAEKPLLRGLELNPDSAQGQYELGRAYWGQEQWQKAEAPARKALAVQSAFAPAHVLLGNILLRKRDAVSALVSFKEYLRLEPKGPFAEPTRELVGKIEKALAAQPTQKP